MLIKVHPKNPQVKIIRHATEILKSGGVIVYPTDTAYALGGIFDNKKVTKKILELKKRKDEKFTLIASSLNQVEKFFNLNKLQLQLAKKHWPGPLSIVVSNKFAVRVPKCKIAQQLAKGAGNPLIATSANLTGEQTPYNVSKVVQADLILDTGKLKKNKPSTIVRVNNNKIKVLRQGGVLV